MRLTPLYIGTLLAIGGCTVVQEERQNIRSVIEAAASPEQTCGVWHRTNTGGPTNLTLIACTGEHCDRVCKDLVGGLQGAGDGVPAR